MKKIFGLILAVAMVFSIVAGCQQNTATQSSEPAAESSTAVASSQVPAEESTAVSASGQVPAGEYKIAYTSSFLGNSWRTVYEQAVKARLDSYKEKGVVSDYTFVATNNDVTEQLNQLNAILQEDYDVIMIDPVSASSLTSVIDEAQSKGIKVIIGLTMTPYEGIPCFVQDQSIYAKAEAYYICEKLGGKGNVIEIQGVAGDPDCQVFVDGAKSIYDKYPDIKILAEGSGYWNDADAQKEMATMLSTYGDQIDGVFCEDGMAYGIANAFQNAGKATVPMGGDYFKPFIDYWYNNQDTMDTMVITHSPAGIGRALADCAVYTAAGYEPKQLIANQLDPSIKNYCPLTEPYAIFEKDEMNPAWLSEFPDTKAMSIDDAYKSLEGQAETAAMEVYYPDDYIASLFGLDKSLWW